MSVGLLIDAYEMGRDDARAGRPPLRTRAECRKSGCDPDVGTAYVTGYNDERWRMRGRPRDLRRARGR